MWKREKEEVNQHFQNYICKEYHNYSSNAKMAQHFSAREIFSEFFKNFPTFSNWALEIIYALNNTSIYSDL